MSIFPNQIVKKQKVRCHLTMFSCETCGGKVHCHGHSGTIQCLTQCRTVPMTLLTVSKELHTVFIVHFSILKVRQTKSSLLRILSFFESLIFLPQPLEQDVWLSVLSNQHLQNASVSVSMKPLCITQTWNLITFPAIRQNVQKREGMTNLILKFC